MTAGFLNKKLMIMAIVAAGIVSAVLVTSSIMQATAQQQMMWVDQEIPKINGSVNVGTEVSDFIKKNVKMSFITAAETAQKQVANGTVIVGHIGVVQGYLAYIFLVADAGNHTGYLTIVDAGNGRVLYSSEGQPMDSFGQWGGHGFGGRWHGQWKTGGWGMWQHNGAMH
jgi:uncharacterized membrane protein YkoI